MKSITNILYIKLDDKLRTIVSKELIESGVFRYVERNVKNPLHKNLQPNLRIALTNQLIDDQKLIR